MNWCRFGAQIRQMDSADISVNAVAIAMGSERAAIAAIEAIQVQAASFS
jgi:hypothetical protein